MTQFKTGDAFDKNGNILHEFDVVKVFHFIGARRKKHYMYKWLRRNGEGILCVAHLDGSLGMVPLGAVIDGSSGRMVWTDCEVVQTAYQNGTV